LLAWFLIFAWLEWGECFPFFFLATRDLRVDWAATSRVEPISCEGTCYAPRDFKIYLWHSRAFFNFPAPLPLSLIVRSIFQHRDSASLTVSAPVVSDAGVFPIFECSITCCHFFSSECPCFSYSAPTTFLNFDVCYREPHSNAKLKNRDS
jgi:hypothetical protein